MAKKTPVLTELPVPEYIQNVFKEADVAHSAAEAYAKVGVEMSTKAWNLFEEIYPQIDGYYYAYTRTSKTMSRIKRADAPLLKQK